MALVIAGWAGIGKTTLGRKHVNCLDLESSLYSWVYSQEDRTHSEEMKTKPGRTPSPAYPGNYIAAIQQAIAQGYEVVTVWEHYERALPYYRQAGIPFTLCFPDLDTYPLYEQRFRGRGNTEDFIQKLMRNAPEHLARLSVMPEPKIILHGQETLEDKLLELGILHPSWKEATS